MCSKCVRTCVCVRSGSGGGGGGVEGGGWRRTILQMAAVSMAAIKRWEVSGQG